MLNTILIVDDEESICRNLKRHFKAKGFDVHVANNGKSGIELCQTTPIDMVILDLKLPDVNGLDALKSIKSACPDTGVIIITAHGDVETAVKAMQMQADNFVLKPIDLTALGGMVDKVLDGYRTQPEVFDLKRKVSRLNGSVRLKETYSMVKALSGAIEAKDPFTKGHSYRVSQLSVEIGKRLGLAEKELEVLEFGALLHDIGKIGIREAVLKKPRRLSAVEYAHIQRHTIIGEEIIKPVEIFRPATTILRNHHEHFDGRGYPDGFKGEEINIFARVIAVPDAFDAMTNDRPYRKALKVEEALQEMKRARGTQFDPQIVDIFIENKIYNRYMI
ncbi:MAG: response regulator [Deltaproteobacteria bacterium]|nr:MAG: response regulator [Deltaproteobacteria bacterium]